LCVETSLTSSPLHLSLPLLPRIPPPINLILNLSRGIVPCLMLQVFFTNFTTTRSTNDYTRIFIDMTEEKIDLYDGDIELNGNTLSMCSIRDKCESCYKFIEDIHKKRLSDFIKNKDFTNECSLIRILIPSTESNTKYFSIQGIEKLLKQISRKLKTDDDEISNYKFLLIVVPIYTDTTNQPYLSLNLIMKPVLSLEMYISVQMCIEELNNNEEGIECSFTSDMINLHFFDDFKENEFLMYDEYPSFLDTLRKKYKDINIEELEFLLTWGSYTLTIKDGSLYCEMMDINRGSFTSN